MLAIVRRHPSNVTLPKTTTPAGDTDLLLERTEMNRQFTVSYFSVFLVTFLTILIHSKSATSLAQEPSARSKIDANYLGVPLSEDRFQTREFIFGIAFSPDGTLVAAAEANSPTRIVRVFRVESGRQVNVFADPGEQAASVKAMAFSPDGKTLLCGEHGGRITLWDLKTGKIKTRKKSHRGDIEALAFSPDGNWWVTACAHGRIELRRARGDKFGSGRILARETKQPNNGRDDSSSSGKFTSVCFSADSRKIIVADRSRGGTISIYDIATRTKDKTIHSVIANYVGMLPDATTFLTVGRKTVPRSRTNLRYGAKNVQLTQINVWDIQTGKRLRSLHDNNQYGFGNGVVSPDGKSVAVSDFAELSKRSTTTGAVHWRTKLPGTWSGEIAYSPDGKHVALQYIGGIAIFDASTGKQLFEMSNKGSGVRSVQWSSDGKLIATGNSDGYVRIWDAQTKRLKFEQELAPVISRSGWKASPNFVGLTPDASLLVAAGRRDDPVNFETGVIVAYDTSTSQQKFVRHLDADVRAGAISTDGRKVVVATSNGGIRDTRLFGFDVSTGDLLFETHKNDVGIWSVEAISFDNTGDFIRVATGDSQILTFNSTTGKELEAVSVDWRSAEQRAKGKPRTPQLWEGQFDRHSRMLVTSSAEYIYGWDSVSGVQHFAYQMPHQNGCYVARMPNSNLIAISDLQYSGDYGEDVIRFVDITTGRIVSTLETADARAHLMRFSPDGSRLFAGMTRGSAIVYDAAVLKTADE